MTRFDVIKTFIFKTVIPIMFVFFMYQIFIDLCVSGTTINYLYLLMICGIPFGIKYMFMLPILVRSMGVGIAMMLFNIAIGSLIAFLAMKFIYNIGKKEELEFAQQISE